MPIVDETTAVEAMEALGELAKAGTKADIESIVFLRDMYARVALEEYERDPLSPHVALMSGLYRVANQHLDAWVEFRELRRRSDVTERIEEAQS